MENILFFVKAVFLFPNAAMPLSDTGRFDPAKIRTHQKYA